MINLVEVADLQMTYGTKEVLKGLSFAFREGERVGLIGENGAGKSTLLRILSGITSPTSGTVSVNGHVHAILSVGMGIREDLSGRENLYLDAEVQGWSREQTSRVLEEMIEFTELGHFIDQPVRTYSSGMKARVAFASLAFIDPEILIIDEALSVGDHFFAKKVGEMIRKLCERGRLVIIVSHSLAAIESMCNRVLWLQDGGIAMDAAPATVTEAYRKHIAKRRGGPEEPVSGGKLERHLDESVRVASLEAVGFDGREPPNHCFMVGDSLRVNAGIACSRPLAAGLLRFSVHRSDGLTLVDTERPWPGGTGRDVVPVSIDFGPIVWRPLIYEISAEIRDGETILATHRVSIEVSAVDTVLGGTPALRWPIDLVVEKTA